MSTIFIFTIGVVIIYLGANLLVSGAGKFARAIGVSPLIIGLTIVGIGTSLPETVVGIISGFKKTSEISFGNVLGANIFDLCLVIGVSAIVRPLTVNISLIQRELKWMLAGILVVFALAIDGKINFFDGILLLTLSIVYLVYCYRCIQRDKKDADIIKKETEELVEIKKVNKKTTLYLFQTIAGLVILILGGEIIVSCAVRFIKLWNLTGDFVGMTIVSFGTALPELTTSVVAAYKNEPDISIGNVIGTVIYNTTAIIGIVSMINSISVSNILIIFQLPVLILFALLLFPLVRSGSKISCKEGIVLIAIYIAFLVTVFLTRYWF